MIGGLAESSNTGSSSDSSGRNKVRNFTGFRQAEIVSDSGQLQNLSSVTGRPSFEMSRSFANAAARCLLAHGSVSLV